MAWWDVMDLRFQMFLRQLFNIQAEGAEIQAQAFLDTSKAVMDEAAKATTEHEQAQASPTPTPSASPPPASPTAAPTGHPSQRRTNELPDPDAWAEEARRKFAEEQGLSATPKDPFALTPQSKVWISERPQRIYKDEQGQRHTHGGIELRSLSDVTMDPYRWDAQQAKKMAALMEQAGMDTKGGNVRAMADHWRNISVVAANFWQVGKKVSPLDVLKRWADGEQAAQSRTRTSTTTQVSLTNALTAEQLIHAALSERLGRRASRQEVSDFVKALKAAEEKDPTTTTTTTTTDPQGNTTSSSKTKEGVNAAAFAQDFALGHNKEEAGAYQAAGIMIPWLFEALKSPV